MTNILKIDEFRHDIGEEHETHALNSSMIQIFSDYMDQRQVEDIQKANTFDGKNYNTTLCHFHPLKYNLFLSFSCL